MIELSRHDDQLVELYKELQPNQEREKRTRIAVQEARQRFPLGCSVNIRHCDNMGGTVVGYNEEPGGFYPGYREPVMVKIDRDARPVKHSALNLTFSYSMEMLELSET